jgi:hypothetical protein
MRSLAPWICALAAFLLLGAALPAKAQDAEEPVFKLTGRYQNLLVVSGTEDPATQDTDTLVFDMNRLRLTPEFRFSENFIFHADLDNEIFIGNDIDSPAFQDYLNPWSYNDLWNPSTDNEISGDLVYRLKLHRAYAKLVTGRWTLTLGRQQVRFGSGRIWNPLDILNPISPTFVEGAEDQKGIDAFRAEYYPGPATEITAVYSPRREDDVLDAAALVHADGIVRFKTAVKDTDIAVLGGTVARRAVIGLDAAGILKGGLLRGAVMHSRPEDGDGFWLAGAGYEYAFQNGLYTLFEYFYNGNALNDNPELAQAYVETRISGMNGERYRLLANNFLTLNAHYLGLAMGYDITPLVRADLFLIYDVEGNGIFISPTATWNMFQNTDLSVSVMTGCVFDGSDPSDFEAFAEHPLVSVSLIRYF